jgi:hypothetical protein
MNYDEDLGFLKISIKEFKEVLNNSHNNEIPEGLLKKSNDLVSNFNCFIYNYDAKSLWEKKKIIAQRKNHKNSHNSHNSNTRNKPRVLLIDFSDEMKCKKEFTSYLNKLTDVNKEIIYNKISNFIKELKEDVLNSLFDVIINFIKISSNIIYIDVLFLFNNDYINNNINKFFKNFIDNKEWLPKKELIEDYNIIYHNDNYDKYCAFIKFKKHALSIIKALVHIFNKLNLNDNKKTLITNLISDIRYYLNMKIYKHILELLLDELPLIHDNNEIKLLICDFKLINFDNKNFDYSTKFKILKLIE